MSKKSEGQKLEFIGEDTVENVFTDVVQVNVDNETVSLRIGLKKMDGKSAKLSHNIIMTLPHFMRLVDVCNSTKDTIIKQFNDQQK